MSKAQTCCGVDKGTPVVSLVLLTRSHHVRSTESGVIIQVMMSQVVIKVTQGLLVSQQVIPV